MCVYLHHLCLYSTKFLLTLNHTVKNNFPRSTWQFWQTEILEILYLEFSTTMLYLRAFIYVCVSSLSNVLFTNLRVLFNLRSCSSPYTEHTLLEHVNLSSSSAQPCSNFVNLIRHDNCFQNSKLYVVTKKNNHRRGNPDTQFSIRFSQFLEFSQHGRY